MQQITCQYNVRGLPAAVIDRAAGTWQLDYEPADRGMSRVAGHFRIRH